MTKPNFSVEKLRGVKDVYFHESCPDGSAAAFICAAAFAELGMKPNFWSLQYNTELMEKLEPRPGQLFVDITPPKERWQEWKSFEPIVLDHHDSAKHVTEGLDGVYATNERHSGAMLAFEQVMKAVVADTTLTHYWMRLAELAMIRDTWKKEHSLWRESCAMAMALLFEGAKELVANGQHVGLEAMQSDRFQRFMDIGHKLVDSNDRRMEKLAKSAYRETYSFDREYKAAYFNCTEKIVSDVANYLIDGGCNIAVGYFYLFEDGKTRMQVSVRTDGTISAKKVAEALGGGGHERASGFRLPDGDNTPPYRLYATVSETIVEILTRAS